MLEEELGVKSSAKEVIKESEFKYSGGAFKLLAILTELLDHDFELTVHDKIKWIPVSQLSKFKLAPANIPIADHILRQRQNEKL